MSRNGAQLPLEELQNVLNLIKIICISVNKDKSSLNMNVTTDFSLISKNHV